MDGTKEEFEAIQGSFVTGCASSQLPAITIVTTTGNREERLEFATSEDYKAWFSLNK